MLESRLDGLLLYSCSRDEWFTILSDLEARADTLANSHDYSSIIIGRYCRRSAALGHLSLTLKLLNIFKHCANRALIYGHRFLRITLLKIYNIYHRILIQHFSCLIVTLLANGDLAC